MIEGIHDYNGEPDNRREYRLASSELVHAPGIVAWAINGYQFQRDKQRMLNALRAWPGVPDAALRALLDKKVPYTVEGDVVVFTHDAGVHK